ncbi:hypothetical protein PR002_g3580 [Phytophthora rubi]|uniref:Uncharacterized protein n=1 Tax=Phytophthora rubi TaxID=129364 RepID=A0A6A3NI67_9STRA|nr:hypothetical protein PR002_g3580 [Phytophthora rubi]
MECIFVALSRLFLEYWRTNGETEHPRRYPFQNALKSHHKTIKTTCVASLHSNTAVVLIDGIPSILFHEASQPLRQDLFHFSEGRLCSEAVANTKRLLDNKKNYDQLKPPRSRDLFGVLFNATKFVISGTNINGANINRSRAQRFLDSLNGKLPRDISVRNVELHCLSIHLVKLLHDEAITNFVLSARISLNPSRPDAKK